MHFEKSILFSLVLFVCIILVRTQRVEKYYLNVIDEDEWSRIIEINKTNIENNMDPISFNGQLMNIAQKEAERMADLGTLDAIKIKIAQNYVAFMFKIFDRSWAGQKTFYTNLKPMNGVNIVDMSAPFVDYDESIDDSKLSSFGYGRTVDSQDNVYLVRIFLTRQRKIKFKSKKLMTESFELNLDRAEYTNVTPDLRESLIKSLLQNQN